MLGRVVKKEEKKQNESAVAAKVQELQTYSFDESDEASSDFIAFTLALNGTGLEQYYDSQRHGVIAQKNSNFFEFSRVSVNAILLLAYKLIVNKEHCKVGCHVVVGRNGSLDKQALDAVIDSWKDLHGGFLSPTMLFANQSTANKQEVLSSDQSISAAL